MKLGHYEFKPTLLSILLVVGFMLLFSLLGRWQLHRAGEKLGIAAAISARAEAPEIELLPDGEGTPGRLLYRRAVARGHYEQQGQLLIDNIMHQGRPGFYVLTPLLLGDGKTRVLVNRGWIPQGRDRTTLPPIDIPTGERVVHGRIDKGPRQALSIGRPVALNERGPTLWLALDYAEYAHQRGVDLLPLTLNQNPGEIGGYARDWPPFRAKTGMHYGYAIQWFAFAIIVLVVFIYTGLRRDRMNHAGNTE